jgi:hypothetical protein
MIYTLLVLIGIFNAISELSNHGKINHWGQWWSIQAWENKNRWKPYPMWRYWPFITLTDSFHFFKSCWVVSMCLAIQLGGLDWYLSFIIYSISFTIFYTLLPYIKLR